MNNNSSPLHYDFSPSPVGELILVASNLSLYKIIWKKDLRKAELSGLIQTNSHQLINKVKKQLAEYFQGKRKSFSISLEIRGTTFQKNAWNALRKIPYGETISYQEQAKMIGNRKAAQAIGQANNRNVLPIIIPCHRVISKSGKLHGFAPGVDKKEILLELEGIKYT